MTQKKTDVTVTRHAACDIKLEGDTGLFYTEGATDGRGNPLSDKTLAGLKGKLDERARRKARATAANLPAVIFRWQGWSRSNREPKWEEGFFVGLNAHTDEVTVMVGGREQGCDKDAWFFRKGDPAIATVKASITAWIEAENAAERAREAMDAALKKHGCQARLPHYTTANKAARAVEAEQALAKHLGGEK